MAPQFLNRFHHALTCLALVAGISAHASAQLSDTTIFGWTDRKLTAVVLSTVLPGTGQSYLGHTTKGAALTVATFGSGLVAALSENNVIGRNERLDELKALYGESTNWETSDALWKAMVETKGILDRDVKRRDIFVKLTALLWVTSIVDIVFFSDDMGENAFGSVLPVKDVQLAVGQGPQRSIQATFSYRF